MATISDLIKLFSAIAEDDSSNVRNIALKIAGREGQKGRYNAEQLLKGALSKSNFRLESPQSLNTAVGIHNSLFTLIPKKSFDEIQLSEELRKQLLSVAEEFVSRGELKKQGLPNRNKILFVGPPGCGKSVTAMSIGLELGLPVYLMRFDSLIGSYLGQTAQNLKAVFDFIQKNACVLLIDEVDAISSTRGNLRDLAELDRVVISLMQQLDLVDPAGILICTSNLQSSIDPAVIRRFDMVVSFPKPSKSDLKKYSVDLTKKFNVPLSRGLLNEIQKMSSFAAAEKRIISEARQRILDGKRSEKI